MAIIMMQSQCIIKLFLMSLIEGCQRTENSFLDSIYARISILLHLDNQNYNKRTQLHLLAIL